jgi:hypothetical protein
MADIRGMSMEPRRIGNTDDFEKKGFSLATLILLPSLPDLSHTKDSSGEVTRMCKFSATVAAVYCTPNYTLLTGVGEDHHGRKCTRKDLERYFIWRLFEIMREAIEAHPPAHNPVRKRKYEDLDDDGRYWLQIQHHVAL